MKKGMYVKKKEKSKQKTKSKHDMIHYGTQEWPIWKRLKKRKIGTDFSGNR
jgi:hypothetical protein